MPRFRNRLWLSPRAIDEPNAYFRIGRLQNVEKILGRRLSDAELSITGRQKQVQALIERLRETDSH